MGAISLLYYAHFHTVQSIIFISQECQSGVKRELDGVIAHLVGWELDANTSYIVFRSRTIGL